MIDLMYCAGGKPRLSQYPLWELAGRRVHLLGGSPRKQWQASLHLSAIAEVMSADGNDAQTMATRHAEYWQHGKWVNRPHVSQHERDLYRECWQWSCCTLRQRWLSLVAHMMTMEVSA